MIQARKGFRASRRPRGSARDYTRRCTYFRRVRFLCELPDEFTGRLMKLFLVTERRNRVRRTFRVSVPRQGPSGAGGARAENVFATALCAPLATHRKINICEPSITVYGILSSARLFLFPRRGRAGSRRPYNRRNFLGKNFSPPRVARKPPVRVQPSFFRPCFIFPRIFVRASSRYDVPLTRTVNSLISPKLPEDHRAPGTHTTSVCAALSSRWD